MVSEAAAVAPQTMEVPMVEAGAVRQMRDLASKGWGAKRIARELGLARNTVRRYLRGAAAEVQRHPSQQRLSDAQRAEAAALFEAAQAWVAEHAAAATEARAAEASGDAAEASGDSEEALAASESGEMDEPPAARA